jgi:hypothetical protein
VSGGSSVEGNSDSVPAASPPNGHPNGKAGNPPNGHSNSKAGKKAASLSKKRKSNSVLPSALSDHGEDLYSEGEEEDGTVGNANAQQKVCEGSKDRRKKSKGGGEEEAEEEEDGNEAEADECDDKEFPSAKKPTRGASSLPPSTSINTASATTSPATKAAAEAALTTAAASTPCTPLVSQASISQTPTLTNAAALTAVTPTVSHTPGLILPSPSVVNTSFSTTTPTNTGNASAIEQLFMAGSLEKDEFLQLAKRQRQDREEERLEHHEARIFQEKLQLNNEQQRLDQLLESGRLDFAAYERRSAIVRIEKMLLDAMPNERRATLQAKLDSLLLG